MGNGKLSFSWSSPHFNGLRRNPRWEGCSVVFKKSGYSDPNNASINFHTPFRIETPPSSHTMVGKGRSFMSNKRKNKSFENSRNQQENNQARNPQQEVPDYGSKSQNQQPKMNQKDCRG